MRQDEVGLELGEPVVGDARVGEQAEAGVDAVDGLAAGDDALDRRGGSRDALHRGIVEARVAPVHSWRSWSSEMASGLSFITSVIPAKAGSSEKTIPLSRETIWIIGRSRPCSRAQSIAIS